MKKCWWPVPLVAIALVACGDDSTSGSGEVQPRASAAQSAPVAPLDADLPPLREPVAVDAIEIPYGETEDALLRGYFVYPTGMLAPLPAVIVVHDWWGLDDAVRQAASDIAAQGYMVLAVDLFRGETAKSTEAASQLARQLLEAPGFAESNLRAAHQFLTEAAGAPRIATLGWSLGGYWALESTRFLPDAFSASVVFYTQPLEGERRIAAITTPVLGLYGGSDTSIPAETVRAFRDQAVEAGKQVETAIYADARHGFANPADPRYDEGTTARAWRRAMAFLDRYLREAGS